MDISHHFTLAMGANEGEETYALSYVPANSASAAVEYRIKKMSFHYRFQYTGMRYITNDESIYMPAYRISSAGGMYKLSIGNHQFMYLSCWISNLTGWEYQNMPWRPMPGRGFHFKLEWRWEK
jgi:hypothetical protein